MNPILQKKFDELESAKDYECWYLVKQPTSFMSICYLVSFLKEFQQLKSNENFEDFIKKRIIDLKNIKPILEISSNYRALRVAAFFGLIVMVSAKYSEAIISDTYQEIYDRCNGEFEKTDLYGDIIQRQIEKMFISSEIDEECNGVRKDFRLFPVMLLYKILLELGRSSSHYSVSIIEYKYFVATTKIFQYFLDTLLIIKLFRDENLETQQLFDKFRVKFDNRLIQALKQLNTLIIDNECIRLKDDKISEVAKKVFIFESNPNIFIAENYLTFLGSSKSLIDLDLKENSRESLSNSKQNLRGFNLLVYGVPGSGKSWTVKNKLCPPNAEVRRVVFHPEYTYGDFVGKILPTSSDTGEISYQFIPGPFTSILKEAYNHSDKEYVLIIEEINRGNAPAIFGDSFQLLDRIRDQSEAQSSKLPIGCSQYGIFNENMAKVIFEPNSEDGENLDSSKAIKNREIRIPANLSIIATMNTSDQNVFTLDTAFQRRWNMMQVKNSFEDKDPNFINHKILDTDVTWMVFCTFINNLILESNSRLSSMEDKRLGVYFIGIDDLDFYSDAPNLNMVSVPNLDEIVSESNEKKEGVLDTVKDKRLKESFSQKVLKYLWDDAFKFNREKLFNVEQCKSLEAVFDLFRKENKNDRFNVFNLNVKHDLLFQNDQENKGNNNSQRIYHG